MRHDKLPNAHTWQLFTQSGLLHGHGTPELALRFPRVAWAAMGFNITVIEWPYPVALKAQDTDHTKPSMVSDTYIACRLEFRAAMMFSSV